MKRFLLLIAFAAVSTGLLAQDGGEEKTDYAYETFKDTRIVNSHSVEMEKPGVLKFIIGHRFGQIDQGWRDLWGIDQATMRMGLDYGFNDWLNIGFGRSSFQKTYDGYVKARILKQSSGGKNMPISMVYFGDIAMQTTEWADPDRENYFTSRLFYSNQLLIARKFSDRFSMQIMPTHVHRNLVRDNTIEENDVFAVGGATRIQITKAVAFNLEGSYTLPDMINEDVFQPYSLSASCNIETNGHHFQLHVSNSQGMINKNYLTETTGDFFGGDIHIGFNITRDFQIRGRKYK